VQADDAFYFFIMLQWPSGYGICNLCSDPPTEKSKVKYHYSRAVFSIILHGGIGIPYERTTIYRDDVLMGGF